MLTEPILTEVSPIEHFKELVTAAIAHQKISTSEEAEFYLSNLLTEFVDSRDRALSPSPRTEEPLAITFLKTLETGPTERTVILRELGDLTLFLSGFFSDSLKRRIVDIDYYMGIGSSSYKHLASHLGRKGSPLFLELSEKFTALVDVLAEVSERSRLTSHTDVLRLYERWLKTGSPHTETLLRELGIEPVPMPTDPVQ
ncbi:MAG: hypothetical protein V3W31_05375 [Thermodesulfobacteriota bacterium]